MRITQNMRDYAAKHGITSEIALMAGIKEKSREFVEQNGEMYHTS